MAIDLNDPKAIITLKAPQYSAEPRLDDLILLAERQTSSCFGEDYALAVALRVLHQLALEGENGGAGNGSNSGSGIAGVIESAKEGDLSEKRGNMNKGSSGDAQFGDLVNTTYGSELIGLIKSHFSGTINRFSKC